jgi:hypothetical protein
MFEFLHDFPMKISRRFRAFAEVGSHRMGLHPVRLFDLLRDCFQFLRIPGHKDDVESSSRQCESKRFPNSIGRARNQSPAPHSIAGSQILLASEAGDKDP